MKAGAGASRRWEAGLIAVAVGLWVWAGAVEMGWPLLPTARFGLYDLFGSAALLGWAAGNLWSWLARRHGARRRSFFALFAGPPGLLLVLARLVSVGPGESGDLLAGLAVGVFVTLFLVPVTLTRRRTP